MGSELNRLLIENDNKMKFILMINNVLNKSYNEDNDFSNDISFTTNNFLTKTTDSSITINLISGKIVKNSLLNKYL